MGVNIVCTRCGHTGAAAREVKGSGLIEFTLYWFLIVPGLFYSMWRRTNRRVGCPECASAEIVPVTSPVGRRLLDEQRSARRREMEDLIKDPE